MKKNAAQSHRFRLIKAYSTFFRILISFGWIQLIGRFWGTKWQTQKMDCAQIRNARRLKKTILELNGLFIKVGQLISIMSNFLPENFRGELEGMQDKIPPRPYDEIAERIQTELGDLPENLFKSFNKAPIASASLAQVHEAVLPDGQKVAVKVQYMDIENMALLDLKTIQRILKIVGFIFQFKGINTNFKQIKDMILDELDFLKEAEHIETIADNLKDIPDIELPAVYHELSTQRILTTEFMQGIKVTDLSHLEKNMLDPETIANRIITAYCHMIFIDGIYHADPHPGNLLVQENGSIVFIDFGAVARLSPAMKEGIPQFLEGVLKRNKTQITDSLRVMGFIALGDDGYDIETIIDYFYGRFLQELSFDSFNLKDIQMDMGTKLEVMGDFRKLNISLRDLMAKVQIPKDWVLLERTIILLLGLCTHLKPEMNPMKTIGPYLETFVLGKDQNWKKYIGTIIKEMAVSVFKIPEELNRLLSKSNQGELEFRVKDVTKSAELLYTLGHQILYGLFSMTTGCLAYFSFIHGNTLLVNWLGAATVFFAICLLSSMWRVRKRRKKQR